MQPGMQKKFDDAKQVILKRWSERNNKLDRMVIDLDRLADKMDIRLVKNIVE
jgi:hypothetical protein